MREQCAIFVFLCLYCFTQNNVLQLHLCCCKWQVFIIFQGQIIFHCINIQHILYALFCWKVFGLIPFLAIVNTAATNMEGQEYLGVKISSPLCIYPVIKCLGHIVVLFLAILRNLHAVLHNSCTNLYFHQAHKSFLFFTSFTEFISCLFDDGHSNWSDISL